MSRPASIRANDIVPFRDLNGVVIIPGIDISCAGKKKCKKGKKRGR